jgi:Zn-dependent M16 (insulinase) family peptidase
VTYLCNENISSYESFKLKVLSDLMFQGFNSPFYKNIRKFNLATTYCPNIGYVESYLNNGLFTIGFQDIEKVRHS